jgi:hypothetical protein
MQVPPAIRWEINMPNEYDTLEYTTMDRLCYKYGVSEPDELPKDARRYCENYHRALVEPFVDSRRWYSLLRNAQASWPDIFQAFPKLQEIGVGCCERVHHPPQTYTSIFVKRHGEDVLAEARPHFFEDFAVNMGWASAVVLECAPPSVQSLHLTMVNMDNFNQFATVNRLLSIVYRNSQFLTVNPPLGITKLSLTLRGVRGVHGNDTNTDTGSAGLLRYWERVLNSLRNLKHLEFFYDRSSEGHYFDLAFTEGENTDISSNVVTLVLAKVKHPQLETLRLHDFGLDQATLMDIFRANAFIQSPNLQTVILNNIRLGRLQDKQDLNEFGYILTRPSDKNLIRIREGWVVACKTMVQKLPGVKFVLRDPSTDTDDIGGYSFALDSALREEIQRLPGFQLDISDDYRSRKDLLPMSNSE